jgi:hypothetical protein
MGSLLQNSSVVIFEVFTAVKSEIMDFYVVTPSSLIPIGLSGRSFECDPRHNIQAKTREDL